MSEQTPDYKAMYETEKTKNAALVNKVNSIIKLLNTTGLEIQVFARNSELDVQRLQDA